MHDRLILCMHDQTTPADRVSAGHSCICSSTRRSIAWATRTTARIIGRTSSSRPAPAARGSRRNINLAGRTCRDRRRQRPIARASSADLQGGQSIHASYVRPRHRAREISSSLRYQSRSESELGAVPTLYGDSYMCLLWCHCTCRTSLQSAFVRSPRPGHACMSRSRLTQPWHDKLADYTKHQLE